MQATLSTRGRLWRYNYRILVGGGYWVIVMPVAASQIVTLWMMALATDFNQVMATQIGELMTPILGAFLVAHSLSPEYRSGTGSVLACKPVSLHRVVTLRVGIALLSAVLLSLTTLSVCSVGLSPVRIAPPLLAGLPPLWFLSMLALTCGTLFRSALGGFAVAAGVWALDMALGFDANPFLSARGLQASRVQPSLAGLWIYGKVTLCVLGTVLLLIHGRLLHRVCRPAERRDLVRLAAAVAAAVLLYSASGAAATIGYAYLNRSRLPIQDIHWLRRQLAVYGPVPVARVFGPAFATYVAPAPAGETGEALRRQRLLRLEQALVRWPGSMWADSIAYSLATEREPIDPLAAVADDFALADRYGHSPFAPRALARIIRSDSVEVSASDRLRAARRIVADYPTSEDAERAAEYLLDQEPPTVRLEEVLTAARAAAEVAPLYRRPRWLVTTARLFIDMGRRDEARAPAERARVLALELQAAMQSGKEEFRDLTFRRPHIDSALVEAEAILRAPAR